MGKLSVQVVWCRGGVGRSAGCGTKPGPGGALTLPLNSTLICCTARRNVDGNTRPHTHPGDAPLPHPPPPYSPLCVHELARPERRKLPHLERRHGSHHILHVLRLARQLGGQRKGSRPERRRAGGPLAQTQQRECGLVHLARAARERAKIQHPPPFCQWQAARQAAVFLPERSRCPCRSHRPPTLHRR